MKRSTVTIFVLVGLLCSTNKADEFDFTIIVPPGKVECFFQPILRREYVAMEMDYQVVDGGDLDIGMVIRSPSGVNVVNDLRKNDGNHRLNFKDPHHGYGDYAFCFDNSFSMQAKKTVFFEFFLLDDKGDYLSGFDTKIKIPDGMHKQLNMEAENFQAATITIKGKLNRIEHLQSQLRAVEFRDRSIVEANYDRVNNWSLVNLCVMLVAGAVQVFLVRSLFEEHSRVGRLIRKGKWSD